MKSITIKFKTSHFTLSTAAELAALRAALGPVFCSDAFTMLMPFCAWSVVRPLLGQTVLSIEGFESVVAFLAENWSQRQTLSSAEFSVFLCSSLHICFYVSFRLSFISLVPFPQHRVASWSENWLTSLSFRLFLLISSSLSLVQILSLVTKR